MMKTVVVTGKASGSGKTTLLTGVIKNLSMLVNKIAVIKCSINDDFTESLVTDAQEVVNEEATDTSRLIEAGSDQTILIKTTHTELSAKLAEAQKMLENVSYLFIEGNSAVKHLKPHLIIYLDSKELKIKGSAKEARKRADIIIDSEELFSGKEIGELDFTFNLEKINCAKATLIASILDRKPSLVGKKLNKENIKLRGCQLGFF